MHAGREQKQRDTGVIIRIMHASMRMLLINQLKVKIILYLVSLTIVLMVMSIQLRFQVINPIGLGCMICWEMYGSGVRTYI